MSSLHDLYSGICALIVPCLQSILNGQEYQLTTSTQAVILEWSDEILMGFQSRLHCDEFPGMVPELDPDHFTIHWIPYIASQDKLKFLADRKVASQGMLNQILEQAKVEKKEEGGGKGEEEDPSRPFKSLAIAEETSEDELLDFQLNELISSDSELD